MLSTIYGILYKRLLGTGISKYKLISRIHDLLNSRIQSKVITIEGLKFLGIIENIVRVHVTNLPEIEFCKREIKEGDIVVDVGANIGYFTLFFSKLVGKKGKVIALEPDQENFEILKKNIELNNITNVELIPKAVSNKIEQMRLYKSEVSGGHSLVQNEWGKEFVDVQTITLDSFFKNQKIDLMKIDVEGFELEVIEGSKKLLEKNPQMKLITEFGNYYFKRNYNKVLYPKLLNELGFNLVGCIDKNKGSDKITPMSFSELMEFYKNTDRFILNLIWDRN